MDLHEFQERLQPLLVGLLYIPHIYSSQYETLLWKPCPLFSVITD